MNGVGDFYSPAIANAGLGIEASAHNSRKKHFEKLLNSENEVDVQATLDHLEQFSCGEEMERFMENTSQDD